ncbi:MAG TPA: hypothetical protein VEA69_07585 [Tepidisphaeraceae bacterium]|nr:hypothetical protein [Tepidisphaeraceae bacterium]
MPVTHVHNWYAGWALVLTAFATGAAVGLFFHREEFWGGYASFRRRIVRLGHIACAALGMMNVVYALSPWPAPGAAVTPYANALWIIGGVSMPVVCFLSGWRMAFRHLFFIPVGSLVGAVGLTLWGGAP